MSVFQGFSRSSTRPVSVKLATPKKTVLKRKSLITIIPWLSTKALDDDEPVEEFKAAIEDNASSVHQDVQSVITDQNIADESDSPTRTADHSVSAADESFIQPHNPPHSSPASLSAFTHPAYAYAINPLQQELDRINRLNKLYDTEMNVALSLNMQLESTVLRLESAMNEQSVIADDSTNTINLVDDYKRKYEEIQEQYDDLRVHNDGLQDESEGVIQTYNSLVDNYVQLQDMHATERARFNQQEEDLRLFHGRFKHLNDQNSTLNTENDKLRAEIRKLQYEAGVSVAQPESSYWQDLYHQAAHDNEALKALFEEMGHDHSKIDHNRVGETQHSADHTAPSYPGHHYRKNLSTAEATSFNNTLNTRNSFESRPQSATIRSSTSFRGTIGQVHNDPYQSISINSRPHTTNSDRQPLHYQSPTKAHQLKSPIRTTPYQSRPSTANVMYEDVYQMSAHQAKHFLETELIRVTTQRDLLKNEHQKLPLHGGRGNYLKNERIEHELDEREVEIASLRKKMKDIGIL